MAIIVEHIEDGGVYILLGTGFGSYKALKPHVFFGNLVADEKSGNDAMICVCDFNGNIGWFRSAELRVIRVDDETPEALLVDTPGPS
jgi:hypothetical protein